MLKIEDQTWRGHASFESEVQIKELQSKVMSLTSVI